jgi:hypothetical protein
MQPLEGLDDIVIPFDPQPGNPEPDDSVTGDPEPEPGDLGIPDTIRVGDACVNQGDHFSVPITMCCDDAVQALSLGFYDYSSHLDFDSVSWIGSSASHIATKLANIDNDDNYVLIGIVKIFEDPIPAGDSLLATVWCTVKPTAPDMIVTIDSGFVPPAGVFKINIGEVEGYAPLYQEGTITVGDPPPGPPAGKLQAGGGSGNAHSYQLGNYPNPFNPTTCIHFTTPTAGHVTVAVYSIIGQRVATLVDTHLDAGEHSITWHGTDSNGGRVASGIYFYRLITDKYVDSRKMLLLK